MNIFHSVKKASIAMPSSAILPMASLMSFVIKDGLLTLMAGSSPCKFKTSQQVDSPDMQMLLPKDVVNFIVRLGNVDIDIKKKGSQVVIEYEGGTLRHQIELGNWLDFKTIKENQVTVELSPIKDALSSVSKIYNENEGMPQIQGINVSNQGTCSWHQGFVGAMHLIDEEKEFNFTIPDPFVSNLIIKTFQGREIGVSQNDRTVQLSCGDDTILFAKKSSRYAGHTVFEAAEKAVPSSIVKTDRKALLGSIQRALVGINVNFDISFKDGINIKSDAVKEQVPAKGEGEWTMSVDPSYIKKALGVLTEDEIEILYYNPARPLVLKDDFSKVIVSGRVKM